MADSEPMDGQILCDAIRDGGGDAALGRVRELINGGIDVSARDSEGCTPLQTAGMSEAWAVMGALLDAGAPAKSVEDDAFYDPLMNAAMYGPREMVVRLLDHGFKWDGALGCINRDNPMNKAELLRPCSCETSELLLFNDLLKQREFERLEWLCGLGATRIIDAFEGAVGTNALGFRVEDGDFDGVRWLLDHGAWIDPVTTFDISFLPIDRAVMNHDLEMVSLLIDRGANPNIRNWNGLCALERAHPSRSTNQDDLEVATQIYLILEQASKRFPVDD